MTTKPTFDAADAAADTADAAADTAYAAAYADYMAARANKRLKTKIIKYGINLMKHK